MPVSPTHQCQSLKHTMQQALLDFLIIDDFLIIAVLCVSLFWEPDEADDDFQLTPIFEINFSLE